MEALENKCLRSQKDILHMKFSEFYLCFHNSCELWHLFSRVPVRNCLWCYYRKLITSIALEKCKKNNAILFLLFWYKVFVHSVLKLFNFLVDSVLKLLQINLSFCVSKLVSIISVKAMMWNLIVMLTRNANLLG